MRQDLAAEELGESEDSLDLLERLLRCESSLAHEALASIIWDRYIVFFQVFESKQDMKQKDIVPFCLSMQNLFCNYVWEVCKSLLYMDMFVTVSQICSFHPFICFVTS